MQAASGNYKPLSLVDTSAAAEPMDTHMEECNKISAEQPDVLSSCVCYILLLSITLHCVSQETPHPIINRYN